MNSLCSENISSGSVDVKQKVPNAETIRAIEEVKALKNNPNKKCYATFSELMTEILLEELNTPSGECIPEDEVEW